MPIQNGTKEGISTLVLKEIYEMVSTELEINYSLKEGICPNEWKISSISKVNNTLKASEYRSINVLPT